VRGWLYSNTNYILLGMIIQKVTGHSPITEISRRILAPLGLLGTAFPLTSTQIPTPYAHGQDHRVYQPGRFPSGRHGLQRLQDELGTPCRHRDGRLSAR
jgi:CubicO group peptidase (beta-lactamase class C family)